MLKGGPSVECATFYMNLEWNLMFNQGSAVAHSIFPIFSQRSPFSIQQSWQKAKQNRYLKKLLNDFRYPGSVALPQEYVTGTRMFVL